MVPRFTLRKLLLLVALASVLLVFLMPVRAINRHALDRVKPGMTVSEAESIVGLRQGWYDGIGSANLKAPDRGKGTMPHWLGFNGEMILIADREDRVIRTEFFLNYDIGWHVSDYLWERFTWLQVTHTPMPQRIAWYLTLSLAGTFAFGELFLRPGSRSSVAWHGLAGFVIGPILSIAIFSDGLSATQKPEMLYEAILGPFVAALLGILIGFARCGFTPLTITPSPTLELMQIAE